MFHPAKELGKRTCDARVWFARLLGGEIFRRILSRLLIWLWNNFKMRSGWSEMRSLGISIRGRLERAFHGLNWGNDLGQGGAYTRKHGGNRALPFRRENHGTLAHCFLQQL